MSFISSGSQQCTVSPGQKGGFNLSPPHPRESVRESAAHLRSLVRWDFVQQHDALLPLQKLRHEMNYLYGHVNCALLRTISDVAAECTIYTD